MKNNKLVRDRMPEIIRGNGSVPVTHVAGDDEYYAKLREKLLEEAGEYTRDGKVEELADLVEVVYAILEHKKVSLDDFEEIRKKKAGERGAFRERIILERIDA